ncbi:MAG TPA: ATP-binding cassette domain-containing protein [Bryobacteraceae bacterium]|jgi:phospholipid/cholesterol/gamma-HCH transport system ATP-binding protein|nr:ATP-binding cassette domain-containing protein [Bryobacteraceae bacterium]
MPDSNQPELTKPVLDYNNVTLRFGDTWALRNVNLILRPGETRIILGQAGAGKTTLIKSVIGLVRVQQGTIRLFDSEVTAMKEHELFPLRSRAGILLQEGGLFDSLNIGDNVIFPLQNQQASKGMPAEEMDRRVKDVLRFVELEQTIEKFPSELSGGMRRRVGIARAIVTEPPLVLYDSPTAGLDPITANTIMALIAKERDTRNTASLIVTHRLQDGELMANFRYDPQRQELIAVSSEEHADPNRARTKFIVMKEGEIVFFGTRQEIEASTDEYIKRFARHDS